MFKRNFLITLLFLISLYAFLIINKGIIYSMNDDIALKAIVSGKYTGIPSFYMIFSGFPYSILLELLYRITNKIDWYGLSLLSLMIFYFSYTMYNIIKKSNDTFKTIIYIILMLSIILFLYNNFLIELTFTSVSIIVAICCLILYLLPNDNQEKMKKIIITIGILISFGLRMKACLMILVFFVPALFYKNYKNSFKIKKDIIFGLKILAVLVLCFLVEKSFYMGKDWQQYTKYNNLRSLYYDYYYETVEKLPSEEIYGLFQNAGFNSSQINLVRYYGGYGFYDDIPVKTEKLIEQFKESNLQINYSIKSSIKNIFSTKLNICYFCTILFIILIIIFSKEKKEKIKKILPFIISQMIILSYLIYNGRLPARVINPLYGCLIITNIYIIFNENNIRKVLYKILNINKIIMLLFALTLLILTVNFKINEVKKAEIKNGEVIQNYFKKHSNNFYIYDNNFLESFKFINKFPDNNYINMSGWTTYSPLHKEVIKKHGAKSLKELALKDNVYVVLGNTDLSLYKGIDSNIKITEVDKIGQFYIYKFSK